MIKIKVTTFGALGSLTISKPLIIEAEEGVRLAEVRQELEKIIKKDFPEFGDFQSLEKSALANMEEVLNNNHVFIKDDDLAILPPICGG